MRAQILSQFNSLIVDEPRPKLNTISFSAHPFVRLFELSYMLDSGISMIQVIKNKLQLMCQREGLKEFQDNNIASMIERTSIAFNALLITGQDLDQVILWYGS